RQLRAFNEKCGEHQGNGSACPAIILVRTFRQVDNQTLPKVSTIPGLEELVAESAYIFWAHPEYESGEDGIVRYWRQWKTLCNATQESPQITAFPSVQIMIGALLEGRDP